MPATAMCRLLLLLAAVARADSPNISPASVQSLLDDLAACSSAAQDAIDCFASLQSGVQELQSHLHELRGIRRHLATLEEDLSTLSAAAGIWNEERVTRTLTIIENMIIALELLVGKADEPGPLEAKLDRLRATINHSTSSLALVERRSLEWFEQLLRARDCIQAMPTSCPVRSSLVSELKTFSSINQPPTRTVLQAVNMLRSICSELKEDLSLPCPDLSSLKKILVWVVFLRDKVAGVLQAIRYVFQLSVCLPFQSPFPWVSQTLRAAIKYVIPFSWPAEIGCVSVKDIINIASEVKDWTLFGHIKKILLPKAFSFFVSVILPDASDRLAVLSCDLNIEIPSLDTDLDVIDSFLALNFERATDLQSSCEEESEAV